MADGKWTSYQLMLAVLMVITGSLNTLAAKWADQLEAFGRKFDHPFLQGVCMFIGEFSCLGAYFAVKFYRNFRRKRNHVNSDLGPIDEISSASNEQEEHEPFNVFIFLPAATCDMIATSLMYVGLTLTNAASFQMLRGAVIIFTGLLSVAFLRSILTLQRWIGMFSIVMGLAVVGVADMVFAKSSGTTSKNDIISGDLLIIMAQIIVAIQMVYEQKFITKYNVPPLLAVGLEGMFGTIVLSLLLIPMYFITVPSTFSKDPEHKLENVLDAFNQMHANPLIVVALVGTIVSIAFFNFAGISVTKELNATTRMVLDSVRVLFIWAVSLLVGWQNFVGLQILGFVFLIWGMCVYNDIFFGPFMREYVAPYFKRRGLCPPCCWIHCCLVVHDEFGISEDDRDVLINNDPANA